MATQVRLAGEGPRTTSSRSSPGDGDVCARSATYLITKLWSAGDVLRGTLRPIGGVWCAGRTVVRLRAAKNQWSGSHPKASTLARRSLTIRDDPATPPAGVGPSNGRLLDEPIGSPAVLTVQPGSTLTVRVPGRPDRSAALSGAMRGFIPGRYVADRDFQATFGGGNLQLGGLAADPLCTAAAVPDPLVISDRGLTQMTKLTPARKVNMVLALAQDPLTLTGCQGRAPTPPRTVLLTGQVGAAGVKSLELTGTLGGLRLNEGADAGIALKLVVKLDVDDS